MSNFTDVSTDDEEIISVSTDDEEQVDTTDSSDDTESTEASSTSDDELQKHKDQVYEGMINSQTTKVLTGKMKLEEIIDEKLRGKVSQRVDENISKIRKETPIASEEKIAKNVIEIIDFEKVLKKVPEETIEAFTKEYEALKAIHPHSEALRKAMKSNDIPTDDEMKKREYSYGQRTHFGGTAPKVKQKRDEHSGKYIDSLPEKWRPKNVKA